MDKDFVPFASHHLNWHLSSDVTTAMLDRLEISGLIGRRPNPDDRREILIVLLESGAEKVGAWFLSAREAQNKLLSGYTERELELLSDFFERSITMLEEERKKLQQTSK